MVKQGHRERMGAQVAVVAGVPARIVRLGHARISPLSARYVRPKSVCSVGRGVAAEAAADMVVRALVGPEGTVVVLPLALSFPIVRSVYPHSL